MRMLIFGNNFQARRCVESVVTDEAPPSTVAPLVAVDCGLESGPVVRIVAIGQAFADIRSMLALAVVIGVAVMLVSVTFPTAGIDAVAACFGLTVGVAT